MIRALLVLASFTVAGCATSLTGDTYSRGEARTVQTVQYGVINELRPVIIEGTQTGAGSAVGGVVGAIAGSDISSGSRESRVGSVLIGAAGAIIGNRAEESLTKTQGLEMVISLETGRTLSLVQQVGSVDEFRPGQRIKLIGSGSNTRVSPAAP